MVNEIWQRCCRALQEERAIPNQAFNTWIRPLQVDLQGDKLFLLAPNRFVFDWVRQHYFSQIQELVKRDGEYQDGNVLVKIEQVVLDVGAKAPSAGVTSNVSTSGPGVSVASAAPTGGARGNTIGLGSGRESSVKIEHYNNLNSKFTFDNFVEGKSNQLALAACKQIGENPGGAYNPLFLYGGVGLGKTHLMHAVGNAILANHRGAKVWYLHSERFVADMVKALQTNTMQRFKEYYRTVDALMIDDIQFFAGKDRTQEEFFHTFNALLEGQKQVILTCDRFHKEIDGVEERLKSRFGWGLTVAIEPPELETRVAILMSKAEQSRVDLPYEVAFFIAKRIRSNVRELEGALKRVIANAHFMGQSITLPFTKEALKDLISLQEKLITIENIQKTVAEYYKVKVSELLSKRRSRSIARPRQMAMTLSKELTNHSLPEIGDAFGGRDHTTVLHAHRTISALRQSNHDMEEDYNNLMRILSS